MAEIPRDTIRYPSGRVAVLMCHQDGGFDTDGVAFGEHWWYKQRSALLFAE